MAEIFKSFIGDRGAEGYIAHELDTILNIMGKGIKAIDQIIIRIILKVSFLRSAKK